MINPQNAASRVGSPASGSSQHLSSAAPRLPCQSRGLAAQAARTRVVSHAAQRSQGTTLAGAAGEAEVDLLAIATDDTTEMFRNDSPGPGGGNGWQNDDYPLNYGKAVRVLRHDLPHLLDRPLEVRASHGCRLPVELPLLAGNPQEHVGTKQA
jgi:hypothetical protein